MSLDGPAGTKNEDFLAGYLQAERQLPYNLTVYGRGESSSGAGQSTYIAVVQPDFVLRRATAGVRWDFISRQALTFEVNRGATLQVHRSEFRLQWSAALP